MNGRHAALLPLGGLAVAVLGISAVAFLLLRAQLDPALNQGDPSTVAALLDVVGRRQYAVAPLWPRQAPVWLQFANLLEYADWQFALGLAPGVQPSPLRTPVTVAYLALGVLGGTAHRRADRRSWWAVAALAVTASLGVLWYLNLKAGPTIGIGILPDDAPHEPRERDYFFSMAFWCWGLWAGVGAMRLAERIGARPAGLALAALPIALNWRAVDRRAEPEASLPGVVAGALLASTPERAVLLVAADNDTYPLWYLQHVEGHRRDVAVVTIPLLAAPWYRAELARRHDLLDSAHLTAWRGTASTVAEIVRNASAAGRAVAASPTLSSGERRMAGEDWTFAGFVYVLDDRGAGAWGARELGIPSPAPVPRVDSAAARRAVAWLADRLGSARPRSGTDPVARELYRLLQCPRFALAAPGSAAADSLDSVCNYR